MKLRNKKTGEICELFGISCKGLRTFLQFNDSRGNFKFECETIAELEREWEDYEEPKGSALDIMILTLTNFIENEPDEDTVDLEDCKKMLKKLKAWKRLKDKGFCFSGFVYTELCDYARVNIKATMINDSINEDLKLLFGGKE